MGRIAKSPFNFVLNGEERVLIPDMPPIVIQEPENTDENEAAAEVFVPDLEEIKRQEEILKKQQETERYYKSVYDQAIEKAQGDIKEMADRLMKSTARERDEILEKARTEALYVNENARKGSEQIIAQAKEQYNQICSDAYKTGLAQGFEAKVGELDLFVKQYSEDLEILKKQHKEFIEQMNVDVKTLAIDITEKILCRKISENDAILLEMVRTALGGIRDVKWIQIEVSEDLSKLYDKLVEEVKGYDPNVKIDLIKMPNDKQGTCFIRLDDRVIDVSVFSQLKNIESFLWN
ncbi:MAG: hypothetical protein LBL93_04405 [Ruminococcus sp.]|jgi:flagellar biosynthesis/type III secretory pathway protein FliH|nr:hypothetical protein [Ruminococcus sp.]